MVILFYSCGGHFIVQSLDDGLNVRLLTGTTPLLRVVNFKTLITPSVTTKYISTLKLFELDYFSPNRFQKQFVHCRKGLTVQEACSKMYEVQIKIYL